MEEKGKDCQDGRKLEIEDKDKDCEDGGDGFIFY